MRNTRSGDLKHRIVVQSKTRGASDGAGGALSESWAQVARVWAKIDPQAGREVVAADQVVHRLTHRIVIRRRTDVTAAMRVLYGVKPVAGETDAAFIARGGRILSIVGVRELNEARRWTELLCEEDAPS